MLPWLSQAPPKRSDRYYPYHHLARSLFTFYLFIPYLPSFICLINVRLSLSDEANNKIKSLNIERTSQKFQLSLKLWASLQIYRTESVELINVFASQHFRSLWLLQFSLLLIAKSWNLHQFLNVQINQLFQLLKQISSSPNYWYSGRLFNLSTTWNNLGLFHLISEPFQVFQVNVKIKKRTIQCLNLSYENTACAKIND